eukprot:TRINITY_DN978_c4_g1_i1.p1 TRINITY_DN978_c4_g1~~TRINITY_DN978_c4_g1_i1.p1  ORF type:complete len:205 (-),score=47.70 TRINITY_DN978_c4_g1_i1:201-815(-)
MIVMCAIANENGIVYWNNDIPILEKITTNLISNIDYEINHRKCFPSHPRAEGYSIQYVVEDGNIFISSSTEGFPQRTCFAFLTELIDNWYDGELESKSKKVIQSEVTDMMSYFSTNPDCDKIQQLNKKVDEVSSILQENIETLLVREENTKSLKNKSEMLNYKAGEFKKEADRVEKQTCLQNYCCCCFFIWKCCGCKYCWPCCD